MFQLGINFLFLLIAFLLQNTAGVYFKIGVVVPDITLVTLICIAFIEGQLPATAAGFIAGLLKDLVSIRGFGVNALTHTLIGFLAGSFETGFITSSFILMGIVAIATLVGQLFYVGIAFMLNYQIDYLFWRYALLADIYNALISPLIYLAVNIFYQKVLNRKQVVELKDGQKKA